MRYLLILIFPVLYLSSIKAQEIPQLSGVHLPGLTIQSNRIFDGNALWGYMNGAADLYLEYGFKGLRVQEVEVDSVQLKIEVYELENAFSAFGVLSIKRFRCIENALLTTHDCVTSYVYQAAFGNYYLNVINYTGDAGSIEIMKRAASRLINQADLTDYMPMAFKGVDAQLIDISSMKAVKGMLGLQNGISRWVRFFDGISDYELFFIPVDAESGALSIAEITFYLPEMQEKFINQIFGEAERFPAYITINETTFAAQKISESMIRFAEFKGEPEAALRAFGF